MKPAAFRTPAPIRVTEAAMERLAFHEAQARLRGHAVCACRFCRLVKATLETERKQPR